MTLRLTRILLLGFIATAVITCGGGGGDDGDDAADPATNACSILQLPAKIVNGTPCAELSRSPVVRVVLVDAVGRQAFCTGTMLTSRAVLTAAHCIVVARPVRTFVISGETVAGGTLIEVTNWQVHPGFRGAGNTLVNDAAVLHLDSSLNVPTLPVLVSRSVARDDLISIFGYGQDENGQFDFEDLQSGEMRVSEVTTQLIRADYDGSGSNTCLGDSGGPALQTFNGLTALVGVTSSGTETDCGPGDHSYFTNLQDPSVLQFLRVEAPGLGTL